MIKFKYFIVILILIIDTKFIYSEKNIVTNKVNDFNGVTKIQNFAISI